MDETRQIIRLELDGRWSAEEFGRAILCLSDLYDLRLFLELLREEWRDLDHIYMELMDLRPRSYSWRRRLARWGPLPWVLGLPHGVPPALDEAQLGRLSQLLEPNERLEVRRINYASPGSADLAGLGAVVGHIKDFVLKLIERRDLKRQRDLSDERAELENDRLRLENARQFVGLARDLGYSETEVRRMIAYVDDKQEPLAQLIAHQKLRDIATLDSADQD